MKVHWTDTARRHLDGIYHFIAQDSPVCVKVDQIDVLAVLHGAQDLTR